MRRKDWLGVGRSKVSAAHGGYTGPETFKTTGRRSCSNPSTPHQSPSRRASESAPFDTWAPVRVLAGRAADMPSNSQPVDGSEPGSLSRRRHGYGKGQRDTAHELYRKGAIGLDLKVINGDDNINNRLEYSHGARSPGSAMRHRQSSLSGATFANPDPRCEIEDARSGGKSPCRRMRKEGSLIGSGIGHIDQFTPRSAKAHPQHQSPRSFGRAIGNYGSLQGSGALVSTEVLQ